MSLSLVILSLGWMPFSMPTVDTSVSLEIPATNIKDVVAKLGTAASLRFQVDESLLGDVVVLNVKNQPVQAVMNKLAEVCYAKWVPGPNGVSRLISDEEALKRVREQAYSKRFKSIQDYLLGVRERKIAFTDEEHSASFNELDRQRGEKPIIDSTPKDRPADPDDNLVREILKGARAEDLSAIGKPIRVVYGYPNNANQKPITGLDSALRNWFAGHNRLAAWLAKKGMSRAPFPTSGPNWKRALSEGGEQPDRKVLATMPVKVTLSLSNSAGSTGRLDYNFISALRFYDQKGNVVWFSGATYAMGFEDHTPMVGLIKQKKIKADEEPVPPEEPAIQIEFSSLSKEVGEMVTSYCYGTMDISPPKASILEVLMRPDVTDPLSLALTDFLFSLSKAKHLNLVAMVNDDDWLSASFRSRVYMVRSFDEHLRYWNLGKKSSMSVGKGWCTIKPTLPDQCRANRMDRTALADLIETTKLSVLPTLETTSAYAARHSSPTDDFVARDHFAYFFPSWVQNRDAMDEPWLALRLWGRLSPLQQAALLQGLRIPIHSLGQSPRAAVREILFREANGLVTTDFLALLRQAEREQPLQTLARGPMTDIYGNVRSYIGESTELMPNGIPETSFLAARVEKQKIVVMYRMRGEGMEQLAVFPMEHASRILKEIEQENRASISSKFRFRVGERSEVDFGIYVTPQVVFSQVLHDNRLPRTGELMTIGELKAIRK